MVDHIEDADHARGCQGREYTCTCGHDTEMGAEIRRLRAEVAGLKALLAIEPTLGPAS